MSELTFFWHDYETFGAVPRRDRPAQFAGLRTDAQLEPIDAPVMCYCRPAPDFLPEPEACLLTGILPQHCLERGIAEHAFADAIERQLAQPGTVGVGYNSRKNELGDQSLKSMVIGASAKLGPGTVSAGYATIKDENPTGTSVIDDALIAKGHASRQPGGWSGPSRPAAGVGTRRDAAISGPQGPQGRAQGHGGRRGRMGHARVGAGAAAGTGHRAPPQRAGAARPVPTAARRPAAAVAARRATVHRSQLDGVPPAHPGLEYHCVVTAANLARLLQVDAGWQPLARFTPDMRALLIASRERPMQRLVDLRGACLALANPQSLVAMYGQQWLRQQQLEPAKDYEVKGARTDLGVGRMMLTGDVAAAIMSNGEFRSLPADEQPRLKIVEAFARIPNFVLLAKPSMERDRQARLKAQLKDLLADKDDGAAFGRATGFTGVVDADESQLRELDAYVPLTKRVMGWGN